MPLPRSGAPSPGQPLQVGATEVGGPPCVCRSAAVARVAVRAETSRAEIRTDRTARRIAIGPNRLVIMAVSSPRRAYSTGATDSAERPNRRDRGPEPFAEATERRRATRGNSTARSGAPVCDQKRISRSEQRGGWRGGADHRGNWTAPVRPMHSPVPGWPRRLVTSRAMPSRHERHVSRRALSPWHRPSSDGPRTRRSPAPTLPGCQPAPPVTTRTFRTRRMRSTVRRDPRGARRRRSARRAHPTRRGLEQR